MYQLSTFRPTFFRNPTIQTIAPALIRRPKNIPLHRYRLELNDGDFLDIDRTLEAKTKVAIISHGLEGSSRAQYVVGMTRRLSRSGFQVVAWNMRGCGGELNRLTRSYHSGYTEDLGVVVEHVREALNPETLVLIGFSVGGNLTLKYLGENEGKASQGISAALTYSVPCSLASSAEVLALPRNRVYMRMFLRSLIGKLKEKEMRNPGSFNLLGVDSIRTFKEYDSRYIAPLFGFDSAEDYWAKASSLPHLEKIATPTLLLMSRDDPFLDPRRCPTEIALKSKYLHLEVSDFGGHLGFMQRGPWGDYYTEQRAGEFLSEQGL